MDPVNKKILLHVCCAPCSGGIIETLLNEGCHPTLFFYNPNIHPVQEYLRRKEEIILFAGKAGFDCVDVDHDPDQWFLRVSGLESEPERGRRCQACFDMRLERAALYAYEHAFDVLATTNGISRWKDMDQVNSAGIKAVRLYPSVRFWDRNWRKVDGIKRMLDVLRRENFYQQDYCGCLFSFEAAKRRKNTKTL